MEILSVQKSTKWRGRNRCHKNINNNLILIKDGAFMGDEEKFDFEEWWERLDDIEREEYNQYMFEVDEED